MKNLKNKMIRLGLNPLHQFLFLIFGVVLILGLTIAAVIFTKKPAFAAFGAGFAGVFVLLYLSRYNKKIEKITANNLEEFANLFGYFRIYIRNGFSVYAALKEITLFANPDLRELLEQLIADIDNDKTVQPYVKFAKNFNDIIVEEMMISIYQMVDDGEQSDYLQQFELIFDKFSDLLYQKDLRNKDRKLGTLSSSPLIGSCYLVLVLTVGVIGIVGDLINGL